MAEGNLLLDWVDKQAPWARDALRRHAVSPSFALNDSDKAAIMQRVRHAAGITGDAEPEHAPLEAQHIGAGSQATPRALLCSLGPVSNLGRLAKDQVLTFALDGITLIYGDNGSGKSGYCRITKKICRSLTSDDLLGNVFEPGDKPPAQAFLRYWPDGKEGVVEEQWVDGTPPPEAIKNISVFDSRNARLYVDKQNRIGFLPAEISLLEHHGAHRIEMDAVFQTERKALEAQFKVSLPSGYTPGNKVAGVIARLVVKSADLPSEDEIKTLAEWSEEKQKKLAALQLSLAEDPAALAARCKRAAAALESLSGTLATIEDALSQAAADVLAVKVSDAVAKVATAAIAADAAFADEPLGGIGKDPWRLMYDHAKAYIASVGGGDELPSAEGDLCGLCQQPLGPEASQRLVRFQQFVAGEAATAAAVAKAALNTGLDDLKRMQLPVITVLEQTLGEYRSISAARGNLGAKLVDYMAAAISRRSNLIAAAVSGDFSAVGMLPNSLSELVTVDIAALKAETITFEDQAKLDTKHADDVARLNELKDAQLLHNALATVLARRADLERHGNLLQCIKLVGNQQLSTLVTTIRRQLVTEGLEQRIQSEIVTLDLGHIPFAVSDQSRDGNSLFEVGLKAAVIASNDKVLSEGEQRALALACFLAEVGADTENNGLVVDDPVSSLDHLRIRKVAERLVTEAAKGKQVIVFTHNLLFFNEVTDAAAAATPQVPVAKRIIRKTQAEGFGLISESDEPWTAQKVNDRITRLQKRRKELESITDFNTEQYRSIAKDFYTDLRETWERLVEELLLGKVVERFNSEVKTQSLKGVSVDDEDYKTVFWAMKSVSERSGHDMAAGKNIPTPTPVDMKADLEALEAYRTAVKKRQNELSKKREALEQPPKPKVA